MSSFTNRYVCLSVCHSMAREYPPPSSSSLCYFSPAYLYSLTLHTSSLPSISPYPYLLPSLTLSPSFSLSLALSLPPPLPHHTFHSLSFPRPYLPFPCLYPLSLAPQEVGSHHTTLVDLNLIALPCKTPVGCRH